MARSIRFRPDLFHQVQERKPRSRDNPEPGPELADLVQELGPTVISMSKKKAAIALL